MKLLHVFAPSPLIGLALFFSVSVCYGSSDQPPAAAVAKEAIYYVISPESGLSHNRASDAVYWIVRTACDQKPDQTPEIASLAIHAISRSAERTVLEMMAAANRLRVDKARRLPSNVSATVTATFNDYIKKAVMGLFDSQALRRRDGEMLQRMVTAVTMRLVKDLSMQAALSDKLMRDGKWTDSTSLPVENGKIASDLTKDICRMISQQAMSVGYDGKCVQDAFLTAKSECFKVAQTEAQHHFDEKIGAGSHGLASKVAALAKSDMEIILYTQCPVVMALQDLKQKARIGNMTSIRSVIRSSLEPRS
jgi:hypothetical protein